MAQSLPTPPPGFDDLSIEEQIDYVGSLWQRIAVNVDAVPVPADHVAELDRRLAHPAPSRRPWSDVRQELHDKYRVPR